MILDFITFRKHFSFRRIAKKRSSRYSSFLKTHISLREDRIGNPRRITVLIEDKRTEMGKIRNSLK
jgi:hypothetical protein